MVGPGRLELPTSRLSGVRSNHLSYGPILGRTHPNSGSLSFEERETWTAKIAIPSGCKHLCGVLRFDGRLTGAIYVLKSTGRFISRQVKDLSGASYQFHSFLRKEVIQPQVPLRLPCYDFTPVIDHTVVSALFR